MKEYKPRIEPFEHGKKFGRLTVLGHVGTVGRKPDKRRAYIVYEYRYLCKCDCGNYKIAKHYHLKSGMTRSCGCLYKEARRDEEVRRKWYKTIMEHGEFGCVLCGSDKHYARGLCHACYQWAYFNNKFDDLERYGEIKCEEDIYFNRKDSGIDKWIMNLNDMVRQEKEEAYG